MIDNIIEFFGYSSVSELPYMMEEFIVLFCLGISFFAILVFLNCILNLIFGVLRIND